MADVAKPKKKDAALEAVLEQLADKGIVPEGNIVSYQEGEIYISVLTDLGLNYSASKV